MTKAQQIAEHIVVTFFEAAIPYLAVHSADLSTQTKVVLIGAGGMGLSAVYNYLRQSNPTIVSSVETVAPPVAPTTIEPGVNLKV